MLKTVTKADNASSYYLLYNLYSYLLGLADNTKRCAIISSLFPALYSTNVALMLVERI